MAKRPEVMIVSGELKGRRFSVPSGGILRLGRSSSNDIHVPDEELSRNHCLFEAQGDSALLLTDLASANGTALNGRTIGGDPVKVKVGDVIDVGNTQLRIVAEGDEEKPGVDLGLGRPSTAEDAAATPQAHARRRSPVMNILWLVAIVALGAAAFVGYKSGVLDGRLSGQAPAAIADEQPMKVCEVAYEKVEADKDGIFRYEMVLSEDGVLRVSIDDVPKANRHVTKSMPLSAAGRTTLNEILDFKAIRAIDREYVGLDPDEPALKSWSLRIVYDRHARSIRVKNTQEPDAFRIVREKLEAFSKNELGIWAIQYSRPKLEQLARDSFGLARTKWEEREIHRGNLFAAIVAYREALFYLETLDPKPEWSVDVNKGLEEATAEHERRYADQRFLADRAINLGQWEDAQRELAALLEMVPDRNDDRYREASAKLVDVEKRAKKGGN